jgi:hypothetical protein
MRNYSSPRIIALSMLAAAAFFVAQPLLAVRRGFHHKGIAVALEVALVAAALSRAFRDRAGIFRLKVFSALLR